METPAWRTMSLGARALYIELKALYNGSNNGTLFLSCREAAKRLDSNPMSCSRWFHELHDRGWIRPAKVSSFDWKAGAAERMATTWTLTEYYSGNGSPSADFRQWQPPPEAPAKNKTRYRQSDRLSLQGDSLYRQSDSATPKPAQLSRQSDRSPKKPPQTVTPAVLR